MMALPKTAEATRREDDDGGAGGQIMAGISCARGAGEMRSAMGLEACVNGGRLAE